MPYEYERDFLDFLRLQREGISQEFRITRQLSGDLIGDDFAAGDQLMESTHSFQDPDSQTFPLKKAASS